MSLDINLTNVQSIPIVVNANITAENNKVYHVIANATFTDPTPVEGRGYIVIVRNGAATIGGSVYPTTRIIYRIYQGGGWQNYEYRDANSNANTFVPQTRTINGLDLSANRTLTTANINDSSNKRYVTDANLTVLANTSGTNTGDQNLSGLVPYTGATGDVDLGEFELKAGQIELDQTPTGTAGVAVMRWNDTDGTIDLGLKGGNVTLQVGQEQVLRVVNKTATNVNLLEANYQAVRVTGAQGQRLKVDLAQATTDALSAETIGLVTETINNNQEGFITTSGIVRNINTTGSLQSETWADGDIVYLSPTTAGRITNIKPSAPNHLIIIGYVISAHATQGSIFVKVDNGYELDELHNVAISTPLNNQSLVYETATTLWKNKALTTAEVADSTNKRYVTDANLTVIGNTSGTNTGDQTLSGLGGIPTTRTITINGTTQDLSADRTFTVGNPFPLFGAAMGNVIGAATPVTRFFAFLGLTANTAENQRQIPVPYAVTFKNFFCFFGVGASQPASGSLVLTIRKNGVDTAITITIPAGSSIGTYSDTTNSESFAAGDLISVKAVNNAISVASGNITSLTLGTI